MTQNDIWNFARGLLAMAENNTLYLNALMKQNKEVDRLRKVLEGIASATIPGVIPDGYTQLSWALKHYSKLTLIADEALLEAEDE